MESPVNRWKSPRPKRHQARGRQQFWRRIVLSVPVLVLCAAAVFFVANLHIVPKEAIASKQSILDSWKKSDWPSIRDACTKALDKRPLDVFYLGMDGIASFYDAMSLPEGDQRDALVGQSIALIRKALAVGDGRDRTIPRAQLEYILAKAYYHVGGSDMDLAASYMTSSAAHGYAAPDTHEYLAMIDSALGDTSDAGAEFDKALAADPSPMLRIAAAGVSVKAGNPGKAESLLKEAISTTQDAVAVEKARLLLAQIYFSQSRWDECEAQLDSLIAENPESAEAHYQLGLLYQAKGDSIHARAEWRKAVSIDPMNAGARQKLAERS